MKTTPPSRAKRSAGNDGASKSWRAKLALPPGYRFVAHGFLLAGIRNLALLLLAGGLAYGALWLNEQRSRDKLAADELEAQIGQAHKSAQEKDAAAREASAAREIARKLKNAGFVEPMEHIEMFDKLAGLSTAEGREGFVFEISQEKEREIGNGAALIETEIFVRFKARDPRRIVEVSALLPKVAGTPVLLKSADIQLDPKAAEALESGDGAASVWPLIAELHYDWISGKVLPPKPEAGSNAAAKTGLGDTDAKTSPVAPLPGGSLPGEST